MERRSGCSSSSASTTDKNKGKEAEPWRRMMSYRQIGRPAGSLLLPGNVNGATTSSGGFVGGSSGCFPWPPRSYSCSFCKREFKSAQALGGHMNVHRRDKARLRQSPPYSNYELNPNPNSKPPPPPPLVLPPPTTSRVSIPNLNMPPPPSTSSSSSSTGDDHREILTDAPFSTSIISPLLLPAAKDDRQAAVLALDLEVGLFSTAGNNNHHGLDLELRLGYIN